MKKPVFSLLAILVMLHGMAQKKTAVDNRLTGLDTALSRLLKDWHAAGFAVAVVEKNKVIYAKGFGFRDYENKLPVTPQTLFAIGSCTKAFTSSLLGILEKDGVVDLNKKASIYLPSLHFFNDNMDNSITIRDMMCHRTGLPRHDFSWYLFSSKSRDTLLERIKYLEPSAGIRERFQYNNFMFLTQGMIAEKLTGKTWEENIKEKILTPLGMKRTVLSIGELKQDNDAAIGYLVRKDSIIKSMDYYNIDAMGPAGSINSSVTEMANWVITWIYGGKFGGKDVLPGTYVRDAMGSQMVVGDGIPDQENPDINFSTYGLGWFLASYRGHYRVEHGGNIDGFSASTAFFPSDSIGIIVLANQNSSAIPSIARNIIADRMLKLKPVNWSGIRKAAAMKAQAQEKDIAKSKGTTQIPGTVPSHKLTEFEGIFSNPGYGEVELYVKNDSLFGRSPNDSFWLRHYHYDVFEVKGFDKTDGLDTTSGGVKTNFHSDEMGKIESFSAQFESAVKPIEFKYRPKARQLTKEELEKYTGEYELGGMIARVSLKNDGLVLFVPGQPEYETIATGNHTFKIKILSGYSFKFELNEKNEVTGMTFIQPNGTFKAVKKK